MYAFIDIAGCDFDSKACSNSLPGHDSKIL